MTDFSFVIPVYNCKNTLKRCVKSIFQVCLLLPEWRFEIILVDDGSRDGSADLCDSIQKEYGENDNGNLNIMVSHYSNQGVSRARNHGIEISSGEYLLFIDSDDTVDSSKLAEILRQVKECHEIDVAVYGIYFDYYANGKCYRTDKILPALSGVVERDRWIREMESLFQTNVLSAIWNKIYRRSIITEYQLEFKKDMIILEDLEFSLRYLNHANYILFCREAIYHYYHEGNVDNAGGRLMKIEHLPEVLLSVEDALKDYDVLENMIQSTILLTIYRNLASDKIRCATPKQIRAICEDFHDWIDRKHMEYLIQSNNYFIRLYDKNASTLYFSSRKSHIRHVFANWLKQHIGDFRKWRK